MICLGTDVGTMNLIVARRDKNNNIVRRQEVNAFIEIPLHDDFVFNMMKNAGVPLVKRDNVAYALGNAAVKMAYTMNQVSLKRPMKDGCVNPHEHDAFEILSIMLHGIIGEIDDDALLYYTVPANAINQETDADYHGKVLESIFKAYKSKEGYSITPMPINEALALIYAELGDKLYTGVGVSFGAGQINVCFAVFGAPVFSFSIVNSGDWIDKMAAKATGESPVFINQEKTKVDLLAPPKNIVERAIQTQYRLMIEHAINGIKQGIENNADRKARLDHAIDFVVAGGTSCAKGFLPLFKEVLTQANLPIQIGEVIHPEEALYSVAKGCLIAAENAGK